MLSLFGVEKRLNLGMGEARVRDRAGAASEAGLMTMNTAFFFHSTSIVHTRPLNPPSRPEVIGACEWRTCLYSSVSLVLSGILKKHTKSLTTSALAHR